MLIPVKIKFSKKLYKAIAINEAIEAYDEVADFSFKKVGNALEVEIKNPDTDLKNIIKDEFCNYVLAGMQQHR